MDFLWPLSNRQRNLKQRVGPHSLSYGLGCVARQPNPHFPRLQKVSLCSRVEVMTVQGAKACAFVIPDH